MTHDEFIKKLNDLKDDAESAKEDYLSHLEEQRKAKYHWAILKTQIRKLKEHYNINKTEE